ncbi:MAG: DnaJ domain-containing protein [Prochlorothrix sp.]|nr:DnaJ domain-containing protein [Prochlorothrix sp.]
MAAHPSHPPDHYHTLGLTSQATQAEIKQAYRKLAKQFHPDLQGQPAAAPGSAASGSAAPPNAEQIIQINAAYEVLGDVQQRQAYDRQRFWGNGSAGGQFGGQSREQPDDRYQRTATAQANYRHRRHTAHSQDEQLAAWIKQVYTPLNRLLGEIVSPLRSAITALSADPFDDDLMADFVEYLEKSRSKQEKAEDLFRKLPNPPQIAQFAMHVYYYLNQVGDGLSELERFTMCYDESYLKDGKEMFRRAQRMRKELQAEFRHLNG